MKTKLFFIITILGAPIWAISQNKQPTNDSLFVEVMQNVPSTGSEAVFPRLSTLYPAEPTTASLGRYGEYQMNYSAGLPDISIPLYEIRSGDLVIPIVLRYRGGGIRVDQVATWVGLGWDLFYGGQLTRTVNGYPDEAEPSPISRPTVEHINDMISSGFTYADELYILSSDDANFSFLPDEYYYNIGLENGKFVGKDIEAKVPHLPVKIENAKNWEITNTKGEQFTFDEEETTETLNATHSYPAYTSAWYLKKITSANNNSITYIYQNDGAYLFDHYTWYEGYQYNRFEAGSGNTYFRPILLQSNKMRSKITSKKPKYIYFNGGRLSFELTSRTDIPTLKKLNRIVIEYLSPENIYATLRTIDFHYFYKDNRLMLQSVSETNFDDPPLTTAFTYHTATLPAMDSYSYDYCGYPNGKNNLTPIPRQYVSTAAGSCFLGGADKNIDERYSQAGTLLSVTYPTSGKTIFTWENHRYSAEEPVYSELIERYLSINACTDGHRCTNPVIPIDDDSTCISSETITCDVSQNINVAYSLGMINQISNIHNKYDSGTITIHDWTSNKTIFWFVLPKDGSPASSSTVISLIEGHAYEFRITANCSNITGWLSFSYNGFRKDTDKYNYRYGGLRIKEIANYESDGQLLGKSVLTYEKPDYPGRSSGYITNDIPVNLSRIYRQIITSLYSEEHIFTELFYNHPFGGIYPNNLMYQYVQERKVDAGQSGNGKMHYEFKKGYDRTVSLDNSLISTSEQRGQLLKTTAYDSSGNMIRETVNYYKVDPRINVKSRGFKLFRLIDYPSPGLTPLSAAYSPVYYDYESLWLRMDSTVNYIYTIGGRIKEKTEYEYGDIIGCLPTHIWENEGLQKKETLLQYPQQLSGDVYMAMTARNILDKFVRKEEKFNNLTATIHTNYFGMGTGISSGLVVLDSVLVGKGGDNQATTEIRVYRYNDLGNILEYQTLQGNPVSCLWGYRNEQAMPYVLFGEYPIAQIDNAAYDDTAYTSFEDNCKGSNWTVPGTGSDTGAFTGKRSYDLSSGNISKSTFTANVPYTLSYWGKTTAATVLVNGNPVPATTPGSIINGWKYFEHTFTPASASAVLTISGPGKIIDELRLHPSNALMTTYTYYPLVGVASETGPSGRTTYYEYDALGRLRFLKDTGGKIIGQYDYHYKP